MLLTKLLETRFSRLSLSRLGGIVYSMQGGKLRVEAPEQEIT